MPLFAKIAVGSFACALMYTALLIWFWKEGERGWGLASVSVMTLMSWALCMTTTVAVTGWV